MKVIGYCEHCHRFKYVRVTSLGMVKLAATRIAHGVCDDCESKLEDDRRRGGRG